MHLCHYTIMIKINAIRIDANCKIHQLSPAVASCRQQKIRRKSTHFPSFFTKSASAYRVSISQGKRTQKEQVKVALFGVVVFALLLRLGGKGGQVTKWMTIHIVGTKAIYAGGGGALAPTSYHASRHQRQQHDFPGKTFLIKPDPLFQNLHNNIFRAN